jgi:hypothetical protein
VTIPRRAGYTRQPCRCWRHGDAARGRQSAGAGRRAPEIGWRSLELFVSSVLPRIKTASAAT